MWRNILLYCVLGIQHYNSPKFVVDIFSREACDKLCSISLQNQWKKTTILATAAICGNESSCIYWDICESSCIYWEARFAFWRPELYILGGHQELRGSFDQAHQCVSSQPSCYFLFASGIFLSISEDLHFLYILRVLPTCGGHYDFLTIYLSVIFTVLNIF